MFFDSTVYLVFLALVTVLYWRLRFRAQNCFLLLASYFFYGWWDWRVPLLIGNFPVGGFFSPPGGVRIPEPPRGRAPFLVFPAPTFLFLRLFLNCKFFFVSFFHPPAPP